ncbi:type II toxin-antitoxin system RelE/ParE family toxin [Paenibacillus arenilitoris]|uniref:Type II toxin-antitoxin system RelE/ParE family toxin n=1 Tax=Paenibacillus arenilitoris TaxID=2772299 RepID=A0A927H5F4_9BACL|nr:type II toxin-antitoxin system RelE/ParE family toxin [Paenibacillus arenilitoris]MBD2868895.1 type II toxin-antitoxin system RelE/ParE family toxin [Paenibacillus arenilitoris]
MNPRNIIWLPSVRNKLIQFRSDRFTPEETLDFISHLVLEAEDLLGNPVIGKSYTEETGEYKGVSRIVISKFRIYYELVRDEIIILAILFPGEK